jgi:hypothetical protein
MTDLIQIPLGNGRSYGIENNEKMLRALGPAILSHLGCSYEIKWPDSDEAAKRRRVADLKKAKERRREDAEAWAAERASRVLRTDDDVEYIRDLLTEAYIAGYDAAPKGPNAQ